MTNYLLKQLNDYQCYLICMDYNSIRYYLDDIANEPLIQSNAGDLIIDQLLVAGNGKNRFFTCQFSYGEIKLDTAKNIKSNDTYRRISSELLKQNIDLLKYSILTDNQVESIRHGQVV